MSEQKSKLPDFNEIVGMASKLFSDVKESVTEIVSEYKSKREISENNNTSTSSSEVTGESETIKSENAADTSPVDSADVPSSSSVESAEKEESK